MPNDYVITNGELYHYGVLGMKWGVRRGSASKAYAKASKKLSKMDAKINKSQRKANKKLAKAQRAAYGWSTRSAEKTKWKAGRAQYKTDKKMKKAAKWINKMEETFKDTDVKMSKSQIDLGKHYAQQLCKRSDASLNSFI